MSLSLFLLPGVDNELASLRKCLERLPGDQFGYQPHPRSMTLGQLATHLAQMPLWGATTINTTELDLSVGFEQPKPQTTAELLAIFEEGAKNFRSALEGFGTREELSTPARQKLTTNRPRVRCLSDEHGLVALGLAARLKRSAPKFIQQLTRLRRG